MEFGPGSSWLAHSIFSSGTLSVDLETVSLPTEAL